MPDRFALLEVLISLSKGQERTFIVIDAIDEASREEEVLEVLSIIDTALMTAADGGHEEVARILLRRGAEAWATNGAEQSPLQPAKCKGHQSVVKWLEDQAH